MSQEEDDADKQYEPSQKKLDDARKKGEIPRSADLTTAASYGGLLIASAALGAPILLGAGESMMVLIDRPEALAGIVFSDATPFTGGLMGTLGLRLSPLFLLPAALAIVSLVATRSLVFAPEKLKPKMNRISPIATAKNKFGRSGLFEFAKSFAKLVIYAVILGIYLAARLPAMVDTMSMSAAMATVAMLEMSLGFLAICLMVALAIGGIDFLWQYAEHMRKHRMSRKEMTDEHKQAEGDPHMKQQRRQKGRDIATNRPRHPAAGAGCSAARRSRCW